MNEMTLPSIYTKDPKSGPWLSEAEHVTYRSRRLPTILNLYEWAGKKLFFWKHEGQSGVRTRDPRFCKQAALITVSEPPPSRVKPGSHQTAINWGSWRHINQLLPYFKKIGVTARCEQLTNSLRPFGDKKW